MLLWQGKELHGSCSTVVVQLRAGCAHAQCGGQQLGDVLGLWFLRQVQALGNATHPLVLQRKSGGPNRNTVTQDGPINTVKPFLE